MAAPVEHNSDFMIQARINAASELYCSCIVAAKQLLETKFGKPSSYYDAEKKHVISIAAQLWDLSISKEDIKALANETAAAINTIIVEEEEASSDKPTDGKEASVSSNPIVQI